MNEDHVGQCRQSSIRISVESICHICDSGYWHDAWWELSERHVNIRRRLTWRAPSSHHTSRPSSCCALTGLSSWWRQPAAGWSSLTLGMRRPRYSIPTNRSSTHWTDNSTLLQVGRQHTVFSVFSGRMAIDVTSTPLNVKIYLNTFIYISELRVGMAITVPLACNTLRCLCLQPSKYVSSSLLCQ